LFFEDCSFFRSLCVVFTCTKVRWFTPERVAESQVVVSGMKKRPAICPATACWYE
jgi:hypothetical protein